MVLKQQDLHSVHLERVCRGDILELELHITLPSGRHVHDVASQSVGHLYGEASTVQPPRGHRDVGTSYST